MSKLTERILFLKFVHYFKIREFQEFLKFIKFEFSIYDGQHWKNIHGKQVNKLTSSLTECTSDLLIYLFLFNKLLAKMVHEHSDHISIVG